MKKTSSALLLSVLALLLMGAAASTSLVYVNTSTRALTGNIVAGNNTTISATGNGSITATALTGNISGNPTITGNLTVSGTGTSSFAGRTTVTQSNAALNAFSATHADGNAIYINPSYNYYDAFNHVFRSLGGTDTWLTISNTGNLTVSGTGTIGGNIGGGDQRIAQFRNTGGNGFIEIEGSTKAAQLSAVGSDGELRVYTNATPGTLGTLSAQFQTSGALTFKGTTTNDNAATGYVGEYVSSTVAQGSAVSLTSSAAANITSISLTAGDWEVSGNVEYVPQATTLRQRVMSSVSSTSATLASPTGRVVYNSVDENAHVFTCIAPTTRISIASTTTIYLVGYGDFSSGTLSAFGNIAARRVR